MLIACDACLFSGGKRSSSLCGTNAVMDQVVSIVTMRQYTMVPKPSCMRLCFSPFGCVSLSIVVTGGRVIHHCELFGTGLPIS